MVTSGRALQVSRFESEVCCMEKGSWFRSSLRIVGLSVLVVVLPLTLGCLLSHYLFPTPQIAVIRVEGDIWGSYTAYLSEALEEAEGDPAVRGVVLDISSPGGEVTASEGFYFDILNLREAMPVVASVDEMAASGAYYVASAADTIYAKPASMVGNVGVISFLPSPDLVDEQLITTGPFKLSGGPEVAYIRQMDMMKETFLSAITAQREDRLRIGSDVLSRGEIYLGLQAKSMGLIDEIGSQGDAIASAAAMAKLRDYDIVDITPELPEDLFLFGSQSSKGSTAATVAAPPETLPPGFYYRYVEPLQ
jgi:protease-4